MHILYRVTGFVSDLVSHFIVSKMDFISRERRERETTYLVRQRIIAWQAQLLFIHQIIWSWEKFRNFFKEFFRFNQLHFNFAIVSQRLFNKHLFYIIMKEIFQFFILLNDTKVYDNLLSQDFFFLHYSSRLTIVTSVKLRLVIKSVLSQTLQML